MQEESTNTNPLSSDAAEFFDLLTNDIVLLRSQWRIYKAFFGANKERHDLLFSVSNVTARTLERTLFEATLLGLRRLTDHPESGRRKRQTVSIKGLPKLFEGDDRVQIQSLIGAALHTSKFARNWSDKKIAHSDLNFRSGELGLELASRAKVDDAIEAIAKVIKWVAAEKQGVTLITHPTTLANDEIRFLECIYDGMLVGEEKERQYRMYNKSGRYQERDRLYDYPPWLKRSEQIFDID